MDGQLVATRTRRETDLVGLLDALRAGINRIPLHLRLPVSEKVLLRRELNRTIRRHPELKSHSRFLKRVFNKTLQMLDGQTRNCDGSHAASHSLGVFQKLVDHGYRDPSLLGAGEAHDDPEDFPRGLEAGIKMLRDSKLFEGQYRDALKLIILATKRMFEKPATMPEAEYERLKITYYATDYTQTLCSDPDPRVRILKTADIYHNAPTISSLSKSYLYRQLLLKFKKGGERNADYLQHEGCDGLMFVNLALQEVNDRIGVLNRSKTH